jgi:hypothetical protein
MFGAAEQVGQVGARTHLQSFGDPLDRKGRLGAEFEREHDLWLVAFRQARIGCCVCSGPSPVAIPEGSFSGLTSRQGFEVALRWNHGSPESARVKSLRGERCHVKSFHPTGN